MSYANFPLQTILYMNIQIPSHMSIRNAIASNAFEYVIFKMYPKIRKHRLQEIHSSMAIVYDFYCTQFDSDHIPAYLDAFIALNQQLIMQHPEYNPDHCSTLVSVLYGTLIGLHHYNLHVSYNLPELILAQIRHNIYIKQFAVPTLTNQLPHKS